MVELPKYSGSWGSIDSQESADAKPTDSKAKGSKSKDGAMEKTTSAEKGKRTVSEKELPALPVDAKEFSEKTSSYYDDASDEEEARGVAVSVSVTVAKTGSKRIEYSRKLS